ncbi:zinc finger protein 672-like isoform X1 [Anguilla anguilla]|uniref:zinc finger protein 672-like isoform X10 n=1 Tax=Anguilla anguilla TaxID=7936 RepID=UPI0015AE0335|nr:zinc finger protein 672-like isoform X10 [Anguilla anguilla]XP_035277913.1 zinc finger protein 672-like isoform X1 [Anguilla anguilla]XP_035277922.1 zinc finger protein 672-like isoform X1 [Anguilla anguilla]XP_035277929.1 zinc finger protein 672-like isoform X1 [Anguilla anguilla]
MRLQHPALYDAVSSLQCPRCFITFRDLQTSLQHMRLQHPALYKRRLRARTVFACRRCERTFPSSRQLSTHQRAHRQGREAGREEGEGQEEERQDAQPTSPSLLPLPDRHKCPHCNFLFRDAKTKMRHMNVKDPTGCPLPPPLFFSTGDEEREEEEEVVMAVQVKEEDEGEVKHEEDDFSTALRHRGNLNPASLHQGEGKEGVVKVPIKPDAGDVRTKEETIEGVCECALCGKGFEQLLAAAGQRRRGRRREHSAPPGARGHACGHCRQLCHSQEALRQHQRLHTLERPYLCQVKVWLLCRGKLWLLCRERCGCSVGKDVAALQVKVWLLCRGNCGCSAGKGVAALQGELWLLCR